VIILDVKVFGIPHADIVNVDEFATLHGLFFLLIVEEGFWIGWRGEASSNSPIAWRSREWALLGPDSTRLEMAAESMTERIANSLESFSG
jgi:hypothetical protein